MEKILFQIRELPSDFRKPAAIIVLIISTFLGRPSIFAQVKTNTMSGRADSRDSLGEIVIHQEINFNASPQRLYEILLSSKEFSECTKKSFPNFTAMSASIDSSVGGPFSLFDGHIIGRILELVPGERIVEAWRVVDWPAGIFSIARFEFKFQGSRTQMTFDHVGFPKGLKEHLSIGWQQHYWEALTKYLQ